MAEPSASIISIMGGLGNQMFQFSLGTYIHNVVGQRVIYNRDALDHYGDRQLGLESMGLHLEWADAQQTHALLGSLATPIWGRRLAASAYGRLIRPKAMITDGNGLTYQIETQLKTGHILYFHGYWQSADIVRAVSPLLWDKFTFPDAGGGHVEWRQKIGNANAISLHVRRGDYATNPKAAKTHGTLNQDYYQRAAKRLARNTENPIFFVFSDDLDFARAHLADLLPGPIEFVTNDNPTPWLELDLMARCRHNIIANSTFSWWGAWLNKNPDKQVICPDPWFANNADQDGLIPDNWIKIER